MKLSLADRFWKKVKKTPGCWEWTGSRTQSGNGYGQIWCCDRLQHANRVSWVLHYGPIPEGLYVLHKCDNRACVRPDHLFLGTNSDNLLDCVAKGRAGFITHPEKLWRGHDINGSRFTEADVIAIRASKASDRTLAEQYGVHHGSIYKIRARRTWKHV